MNEMIYITGHRHPDTDSIVSSIAYTYLKNQLGYPATACRLGELNEETKYLLNRFQFNEPVLLKDARVRLSEIKLDEPLTVSTGDTLFTALQKMKEYDQPYLAVLNDSKLEGMITRNDIAMIGMGDTALGIDLIKNTSLQNICSTLDGKIIYDDPAMELNGKVSIVALSHKKARDYEVKNRIVIIGDDKDSQIELIKKGASLLIIVWSTKVDDEVIKQAKENHCSILISGHGSMNTSRYLYFAPPVSLLMKRDIVTYYDYEYAEDVARKMSQYRYRAFPVLNREKQLLGYVLKYHVMNIKNKSIIMVDHNEFSQSAPSIEKAQILEVIDHHRIYDFYSSRPIAFRNEIVGSTATIITSIFLEKRVDIPKKLAAILLGALLSDTLNFQSPTVTQKDYEMAAYLEQISGVNSEELAYDMFFVSSNIKDKSVSDFMNQDVKYFNINNNKVMIAQVIIPSDSMLEEVEGTIQESLEENVYRNGYDLGVLTFTSILQNGSIFYLAGPLSKYIYEKYPKNEKSRTDLQKGILSRKNQIVPMITEIISKIL